MIRNEILDFVIKKIQWGEIKEGGKFYSEKQLSIMFDVSTSKIKQALTTAESMGLITSIKSIGRFACNFNDFIFLDSYTTKEASKFFVKGFNSMSVKEKSWVNSLFSNNKNCFILKTKVQDEISAILIGKIFDDMFYKEVLNINNTLKNALKKSNKLISLIENKYSQNDKFWKNGLVSERKLISTNNLILEKSFIYINPKFFALKNKREYYLST